MSKNLGAKPMLVPQPVMMIGTYDADGNANVMNVAWGGIVGANEIIFDLGSHKTTENIQLNKAFTVAIADAEHVAACDYVGIVSANDEPDKMKKAGFTTRKSEFVNAPIINELSLTMECRLKEVINAFARCLLISTPECPPTSPVTVTFAISISMPLSTAAISSYSTGI